MYVQYVRGCASRTRGLRPHTAPALATLAVARLSQEACVYTSLYSILYSNVNKNKHVQKLASVSTTLSRGAAIHFTTSGMATLRWRTVKAAVRRPIKLNRPVILYDHVT